MKAVLLLFSILTLAVPAQADKSLSLREVVSAFAWAKFPADFPVTINGESKNQISFLFFDDQYVVEESENVGIEQTFALIRQSARTQLQEKIILDEAILRRMLTFVENKKIAEAKLSSDDFLKSIQKVSVPLGFQESKSVYQCISDLPLRSGGTLPYQPLSHTWIQVGADESFGMPNTDEATAFGGVAHIRTPDSFIVRNPYKLQCTPVLIPSEESEVQTSEKTKCIARHLSLPQDEIFRDSRLTQRWVAHLDYHVLERNCLSALRFVLECGGTKAPIEVNAGIGGTVDWTHQYSVTDLSSKLPKAIKAVRLRLKLLRKQSDLLHFREQVLAILTHADKIKAELHGAEGVVKTKSLKEICMRAQADCS